MRIKSSYDPIVDSSFKPTQDYPVSGHTVYVKKFQGCARIRVIGEALLKLGFGFGLLNKSVREICIAALRGRNLLAVPNHKISALSASLSGNVTSKSVANTNGVSSVNTSGGAHRPQQYFFMSQRTSIDMPYVADFMTQNFPNVHMISDVKKLKENDVVIYFDFVNSRYGRFEGLDEDLLAIQEKTKKPTIYALIINDLNPILSSEVEKAFKEKLTADFIYAEHRSIATYDHTGLGNGEVLLKNPQAYARELKQLLASQQVVKATMVKQVIKVPVAAKPAPVQAVHGANKTEAKKYFYMPSGHDVDMPYIKPFIQQYYPDYHILSNIKDLKKGDKVIYFDSVNARYGRFEELDEELKEIQQKTKSPAIFALLANSADAHTKQSVEATFREKLTADFSFVFQNFKVKWDPTGMGKNQVLLEDPVALARAIFLSGL